MLTIKLFTTTANGQMRKFRLGTTPILIGRGDHCTIRVPLTNVSREHCRIDLKETPIHLTDLETANGTAVNGERVSRTQLFDGDTFTIGSVDFLITIEETDGSETEGADTENDLIGMLAGEQ
jgi:pSer/pThr/pTyr-binding forkhead associated (FHA) protein